MSKENGGSANWRNRIVGSGEESPDQLMANPANFRIHPKAQQAALEGSLDTLGWIQQVLVNRQTQTVIDGHLRVALALRHNVPTVPVLYVDLSPEEEQQALLSLDPIAALASTDKAKLDELLHQVQSDDERVQQFLSELAEREGIDYGAPPPEDQGAQIDRAEELRQKWGVELGSLWKLGDHRLICGDCTDRATVERVMMGEKAEIGFTSPPYLEFREYSGNDMSLDILLNFVPLMVEVCNYCVVNLGMKFKDAEIIRYWDEYLREFHECGLKLLAWNVWDKTQAGTIAHATNMFCITHEWIFVFGRDRKTLNRTIPNDMQQYHRRYKGDLSKGVEKSIRESDGSMRKSTSTTYEYHQLHSVIQQTPELGPIRAEHPAIFPVGLPTQYIEAMTDKDHIIYEPFSGSGTTLIACERLGRKCRAVEISPGYCAVALERWAQMTGKTPELINA